MEDITKLDLYSILEIPSNAGTKDIKKAYRQKALQCHPDKNPDNPHAAKLFHQLKRALELLIDERAREAYDKVLKAREAVKLRNELLDTKRKKFKEELEYRERLAQQTSVKHTAEEQLKREIERLRKEGNEAVEKEAARVRQQLAGQMNEKLYSLRRVQARWKADKDDPDNGGYNEKHLTETFSKSTSDLEAFEEYVLRGLSEAQAKKNATKTTESKI